MTPGSMDFRGAFFWRSPKFDRKTVRISVKTFFFEDQPNSPWTLGGPWASRGPFFGDHLNSTGKTVRISVKTFFFKDHIIFRTKLWHFVLLFWTSQNRKSVIFELAPGPRLALGAPKPNSGVALDKNWNGVANHAKAMTVRVTNKNYNIRGPDVVSEVEYLCKVKKDGVNANLVQYDFPNFKNPHWFCLYSSFNYLNYFMFWKLILL